MSYQQPQAVGQSVNGTHQTSSYQPQQHEPEYSRLRSRSDGAVLDNYSVASGVTDSTVATMKRGVDLNYSDAASAITLPAVLTASRRITDTENGYSNGHATHNAPLINRQVEA